jgi:succinate-semialdehyde dehydrogenase
MAQTISREMGKPILQARAEVAKSAGLCDWYAEHGPAMLRAEPTLVENHNAVIEYRPLGPILADAVELPALAGAARRGADPAGR